MILTSRFQEALQFAFILHQDHQRKGTEIPYLSHLISVAGLALEYGATEDEAIAALLHDAIEDQAEAFGGSALLVAEIEKRFGSAVLEIVLGCTDTDTLPKPPWQERKLAYIQHVETASSAIRLVSMADKLHNARCILSDYKQIGEALWKRFKTGKEGTLWYYRALVEAFRKASPAHPLVAELDVTVAEIERLALGQTLTD